MSIKVVSADIEDDGVVRLTARDDRLDTETSVYALTDGDVWTFVRSRHLAAEILRGDVDARGPRIHHRDWELTADA